MPQTGLIYSARPPIGEILLNRPEKHNSLTLEMWRMLPEAVAAAAGDRDVLAVRLRGAGDRSFSAGADISEFATAFATAEAARHYQEAVTAGLAALAGFEKPLVAEIGGICVGGGCALSLTADIRFAAAEARLGITPAKIGFVYPFDDVRRLVRLVGPSAASDLLFAGRLIDAAAALSMGLVDRVCPAKRLAGEVDAWLADVCRGSHYSILAAKAMIRQAAAEPDASAEREVRRWFEQSFDTEDFREGHRAFVERRAPEFTWRSGS